ncbi:hypothetical protein RHMOL_Rhmol01G0045700 [Rhododendron molle]|uniref:Uncharacterized protein n=1 Tax=Rhododendron molle TaxID=49168 RepID=A0ACC0PZI6_RHOML|nr:hypothetical protein RHMOL_Rhmol01G0045700 [Rhododendron molle]
MGSEMREDFQSDEGGWIPVISKLSNQNGKKILGDQQFFTLYVDNLPEDVGRQWLRKTFNNFGVVKDVYIPLKRSRVPANRFGFIQYNCSISAYVAILRANGLWMHDKKLFVKRATFEQGTKIKTCVKVRMFHPENFLGAESSKKGFSDADKLKGDLFDNGKYFGQVIKSDKNNGVVRDLEAKAQVVKSDKNDRVVKEMEAKVPNINTVGNEWLNRSAVANLHKVTVTEDLEFEFKKEKVEGSLVRAMGARRVLITFRYKEMRDLTIKEKWLSRWFGEIKPWSDEVASFERIVWVICLGVPLNVWSVDTLKKIGDIYGEVLSVDEDIMEMTSFANGRILIATVKDSIDEWINIQANNSEFRERVQVDTTFPEFQLLRKANLVSVSNVEIEENEVVASKASLVKGDDAYGADSTNRRVTRLHS